MVYGGYGREEPIRGYATRTAGHGAGFPSSGRMPARRGRGLGTVGVVLAVIAGGAALALVRNEVIARGQHRRPGAARPAMRAREPEVARSITIEDVTAEELHRRWCEPETLRRIMAPFADIQPVEDGRTRWDAGRLGSWTMRLGDDRPGESARWEAEGDGAPVREVSARFRKATGNRGTVMTLHAVFDPPGGMLGRAAARMFGGTAPGALATKVLHSFKALVQTGEIPTTERQPAARRDTR